MNLFAASPTKEALATFAPDAESSTDAELIARINRGEEAAFGTLYERHRDWVAGLAFRLTGDHGLAMDVVQETFLYVLRKFPGFTLTCQFRSFLYPAVRNLAIAARQKAVRLQGHEELDPDALEAPAAGPDPEAGRARLAAALASLPEPQREVLLLRVVDGLNLQEIGEAMGVPLGTVKSRLHHALAALRKDDRARELFGEER